MFIGHFAIGYAAKKTVPDVSLGTLFIAAQFLDLLWPVLLLLGIERAEIVPGITVLTPFDFTHYPYTHSLAMALLWSVVVGGCYYIFKKERFTAFILGLCVVSHWVLDLLVHRPDLPLYPGDSPVFGMGLWNQPLAAIALEALIFIFGVARYLSCTTPKNKTGTIVTWVLILFLVFVYLANFFGPPPPNMQAVAWAGNLQWLFVVLAFWSDKNRQPRLSN
ncbi:MAG TPA: metal-dependent hydrolase [Bacteroidia bacterium]|nr:metal-dependent hydrolase [Bacteroidia bacterium]